MYTREDLEKYIKNHNSSIVFQRDEKTTNKYNRFREKNKNIPELIKKKPLPYFAKNRFPYDVGKDIKHYLYWYEDDLSHEQIDDIISKKFHNNEFIWFINNKKSRSVPEIKHAHIFVFV
jgi:hypothetical protein